MVKYLFGFLLQIIHYIIIPLFYIWIYFYVDNFLLNLILLFLLFVIIVSHVVLNDCPLIPIEDYLLNNSKTPLDFIIDKIVLPLDFNNKINVYIFEIQYTIFMHNLSITKLLITITSILFFIKLYYLYLNKNINV